jgi:hypothetical protein
MEDRNYFISPKEIVFFCFSIQFIYLSSLVISINTHIAASSQALALAPQITTIISITTR